MIRILKMILRIFKQEKLIVLVGRIKRVIYGESNVSQNTIALDPTYDVTPEEFFANQQIMSAFSNPDYVPVLNTVTWFLPYSEGHPMGGRNTIYKFASFLEKKNINNRYVLFSNGSPSTEDGVRMLRGHVPYATKENVFIGRLGGDLTHIPDSDIAIATKWNTAYPLLRFNRVKGKFYFMQDFEPLFYPASTAYMLAEATYRFGFYGLVNSEGLAEEYLHYSPHAEFFIPAVDTNIYYPSLEAKPDGPVTIFFYGRPSVARNGFLLGIVALKKVKERYGSAVDIVCAGEEWDPSTYHVEGKIRNLGLLKDLQSVAQVYRDSDIGLGLIFTKHPSYQPFEYMATKTATVTNWNRHTNWLLKDGVNCLLSIPTPSCLAEKIGILIDDQKLRTRIQENGLAFVRTLSWENEFEKLLKFMKKT